MRRKLDMWSLENIRKLLLHGVMPYAVIFCVSVSLIFFSLRSCCYVTIMLPKTSFPVSCYQLVHNFTILPCRIPPLG